MTAPSDRAMLGEAIVRRSRSSRTFVVVYGPLDWYFRVRGWGLRMVDHRRMAPLYTERHPRPGVQRWYLHLGPICLRAVGPANLPKP